MTKLTTHRNSIIMSMKRPADPIIDTDAHGLCFRDCPSYVIQWSRIDSYPKLCEWICHLAPKNWVTKATIRVLIATVENHFRWPHHYGA